MQTETVNRPPYYQTPAGIGAINVCEGYNLGPHLFIAMAHLLLAGKDGDPIGDLRTAGWYVARALGWGNGFWHEEEEYYDPRDYAASTPPHVVVETFGIVGTAHAMAVQTILAAARDNTIGEIPKIQAALGFIEEAIAAIERERKP